MAFAFGFIGSMPLTGPIAVMVFSLGVRKRYGVAVRVGLGAAAAEALYATVAFWGFTTFLADRPIILPISHGVSTLVLAVLGVYFLRWRPEAEEEEPSGRRAWHVTGFLLGFTLSALNPTLLATWSAAVAFLYSRQLLTFSEVLALPFGAAAGAGVACWELLFVWLLRRYENQLPRSALTWVVRGMGLLLIAAAFLAGRDLVRELSGTTR
ncbi:LysE family transporter [Archangium violaceum]|uniref:LysE family transporter n=1 Tax=Archangium violaceum TaxID=83451 RepID=UPI00194E75A1|nr:LysE family transporter [Archangium violaceum]QRN96800.1 LysE family transporter [Archangium violaceum]